MNIDSLVWLRWLQEVQDLLQEAKIAQIRQIDINDWDWTLLTPRGTRTWHMSFLPMPRMWLSQDKARGSGTAASPFCMILRKYLEGCSISSCRQLYGDKLICLTLSRIEAGGKIVNRELFFELLPAGPNLILTEDNKIIAALHSRQSEHREIRPQETYILPLHSERMNWLDFTPAEIIEIITTAQSDLPLRQRFFRFFNGFSKWAVEDLFPEGDSAASDGAETWTETQRNNLARRLQVWQEEIKNASSIYIYRQGKKEFATPLRFASLPVEKTYPSANDFFREIIHGESIQLQKASRLRKKLASLHDHEKRKLEKILAEERESEKAEQYKQKADLLMIYSYLPSPTTTTVTVDNVFVDPAVPMTIGVQPGESWSENSQRYYKKYRKLKNRNEKAGEFKAAAQKKLAYLESIRYFLSQAKSPGELTELETEVQKLSAPQKTNKTSSRQVAGPRMLEFDGYRIGIGKNNAQNDLLTLKMAGPQDLWFHTKEIPGSHVIVFANPGEDFSDEVITYAASLAAAHSQAAADGKVAVDYTYRKFIRKPKDAPPGFVHYTHQKTIIVAPETSKKASQA